MPDFLLLFRGGDTKTLSQSPEQWQSHMQRWMEWIDALAREGKSVGAQPLSETGKIVKGSEKIVTDGPYVEGKEMVAGYLVCNANSEAEAIEIAKGSPILAFADGIVEVREIRKLSM